MKQILEILSLEIQKAFPDASIEYVTMFAQALQDYQHGMRVRSIGKPLRAKDIKVLLKACKKISDKI